MATETQEFYAHERWPDARWPKTRWWHRLYCWWKGEHSWRRFLWAWVDGPFDLDVCWGCYKCKGPLPNERKVPDWPSVINPCDLS